MMRANESSTDSALCMTSTELAALPMEADRAHARPAAITPAAFRPRLASTAGPRAPTRARSTVEVSSARGLDTSGLSARASIAVLSEATRVQQDGWQASVAATIAAGWDAPPRPVLAGRQAAVRRAPRRQ